MNATIPNILLLSAIWGVCALLWTPSTPQDDQSRNVTIRLCIHGLWTSFLIMVLAAMALGLADVFNRLNWSILVLALSLPRLWYILKKTYSFGLEPIISLLAPVLILLMAWFAPDPGHWIAGGWDPGVYMNQGAAMARTGSLHPDDSWFTELIPESEKHLFMRVFPTRNERFPGIVTENGRIPYQFSRFFPSAVGLMAAWGWIELASRLNYVIAILCLLTAFGWGLSLSKTAACVFPALLLTQPIFTYHTNLPVTEMLELGLILWTGMIFFQKQAYLGDATRVAFALFCAILNRFSMIPFAGIFLVIGASFMLAVALPIRLRLKYAILYLLATTTGLAMSFQFAPVSIRGWRIVPVLIKVYAICSLVGISLLLIPLTTKLRNKLRTFMQRVIPIWIPLALFITIAFFFWFGSRSSQNPYLYRLIPFLGLGWSGLFLLAAGFAGMFLKRQTGALIVFLCLFAVTGMMLMDPQITVWYPWALRRYLAFTVPLLSLTIMMMHHSIAEMLPAKWGWKRQLAPLPLLLAGLVFSGNTFLDGARLREYRGLYQTLEQISHHIPANAIVVSDDPRWGTPLQLVFGHKVLFGRHLWGSKDEDVFKRATEVMKSLPGGYKILFLTSTPMGMEIYPLGETSQQFETLKQFPPVSLLHISHHPRARHFALQHLDRDFRLHQLQRH